jgi:outer membrane protein TolC
VPAAEAAVFPYRRGKQVLGKALIAGLCGVFLFAGTNTAAQTLRRLDNENVQKSVQVRNDPPKPAVKTLVSADLPPAPLPNDEPLLPKPAAKRYMHYLIEESVPEEHPAMQEFNSIGQEEINPSGILKQLPDYNQTIIRNFRAGLQKPLLGSEPIAAGIQMPVASRQALNDFIPDTLDTGKETLCITLSGALTTAILNNPEFRANKIQPRITATDTGRQLSVFDPHLTGSIQTQQGQSHWSSPESPLPKKWEGNNSLQTQLQLDKVTTFGGTYSFSGSFADNRQHQFRTQIDSPQDQLSLQFQQHLLQGRGIGVNLASVQQSRLQTVVSRQEFLAYAQNFIAGIETAALDYIAAVKKLELLTNIKETQIIATQDIAEKIRHGREPAVQQYAYLSQLSNIEVQRIAMGKQAAANRITLLGYIYPKTTEYWKNDVEITYDFVPPGDTLLSADAHIQQALAKRPDIVQARILWEKGELEVVKTKNGMLPKLDFFVSFDWMNNGTKYEPVPNNLGGTTAMQNQLQATAGLQLDYYLGNRDARSKLQAAKLSLAQQRLAIENLENQAKTKVFSQFIAVAQQLKMVSATNIASLAAYNSYLAEVEKQKGGKADTLSVAQSQANYIQASLNEVDAVIDFRKALVALYLADGSILERRGIEIK